MNDLEYKIHVALVEYVTLKYPNVDHRSDLGGIRLPMGLAIKVKRLNGHTKSWPDYFIAQPTGRYCGLFIEIKKDRNAAYKKDGLLRESEHITEQHWQLVKLREKGYKAVFGCGLDECMAIVDEYLNRI
jgi:hypothetical protein